MFMAARSGEGATSMATSFALLAAARARRSAWLVDLDLRRNPVINGFRQGFARGVGDPGKAYDASLGTAQIFSLTPKMMTNAGRAIADPRLLMAHPIDETRLMVTRFRTKRLRPGQKVQLQTQPEWWDALRRATDWIIVDAPALERSAAGLVMAGQMDGVVLVVEADRTRREDILTLQSEIELHGGRIVGIALNRRRWDARLADRMSG